MANTTPTPTKIDAYRLRGMLFVCSIVMFLSLHKFGSHTHNANGVCFAAVQEARDTAFAHNHDAVRHAQQFGHFRRDHDNRLAFLNQVCLLYTSRCV